MNLNTNWLITGASAGLGLELAKALRAQGARVAIVAREEKRLNEVAEKYDLIPIHADVANKEHIYRISAEAAAYLGEIDVLVNNASSLGATPLKFLNDTECEELEQALMTNVIGAFRLSKAISGQMLLRQRGTVVNISSDAAVNAYAKWGAYGASKAALLHLTKIWDEETRARGVRWLSYDPGDMDTDLHAVAVPDADRALLKTPERAALELIEWWNGRLA